MLTTAFLKRLYARGLFPMAEGSQPGSAIHFYASAERAVIVPATLHVSRRLRRVMRQCPFTFKWNDDLRAVMTACNATRPPEEHWINDEMIDAYVAWQAATGEVYCLSIFQGGVRVAGIFGVHPGGAMATAEGMYATKSYASSVGVVTLVAGMARAGIQMIDLQYGNPHTAQFGLTTLSAEDYLAIMTELNQRQVTLAADYFDVATGISFVQSLSQTS